MFNFIDIGERAGSGIPNIFRVWKEQKWSEPVITEEYNPDRTTLSLGLSIASDKKQAINHEHKTIFVIQKDLIIDYLTDNPSATTSEISTLLGVSNPRARAVLSKLTAEGIIVAEGANRNRRYKLKS